MSFPTTDLKDVIKAAPSATDTSGKSVVLADENGNLSKISEELAYFKHKCKCLFGTDRVVITGGYLNQYTLDSWKGIVNRASDQWGGFMLSNSQAGDICVLLSNVKNSGEQAILYSVGLDVSGVSSSCRATKPLLLEIANHQPLWSTNVPTIQ